jgi:DNA-binding GntR family transcriptional regulator
LTGGKKAAKKRQAQQEKPMNALNALTKTELRILAAAGDGATFEEICEAVDSSPDYIRNSLSKLTTDGWIERQPQPSRFVARVKVEVKDVRND